MDWVAHMCVRGFRLDAMLSKLSPLCPMEHLPATTKAIIKHNRKPDWLAIHEQDLTDDKICINTTPGWAEPYSGGLLDLAGGPLTKGNARHISPEMPKQDSDRALISTDSTDNPDLAKHESERASICTETLESGALEIDRAHTQSDLHINEAELIQIFIKTLEGRHVCWRIGKGKRIQDLRYLI